jgi:hypothetical protein
LVESSVGSGERLVPTGAGANATGQGPPSGKIGVEESLIGVGVDAWRLLRLVARVLHKLDPMEANRFVNQLRYFENNLNGHLSSAGVRLVNVEGQRYEAGMPVTALNADEFTDEQNLVVDRMIEPIVMGEHGILREGTAILAILAGKVL